MNDLQDKLEELRAHARECAKLNSLDEAERQLLGRLTVKLHELIADLESVMGGRTPAQVALATPPVPDDNDRNFEALD
jgi:hypothetical protein